jgi:peptidoglycan/LPS O-acetylase OafA/YrhL
MARIQEPQTTDSEIVAGNRGTIESRAFYPALDGLRAIAFLVVFGHHYLQLPWGWAGVDLFFVLSGFLITGILFDSRHDLYRVRNFYVRRTLRIFPLYYGVMLALLLMQPFVHWNLSWHWMVWPAYVGNYARFIHPYNPGDPLQRLADFQPSGRFLDGHSLFFLGHFWSLCVEEQFYLAWPWIFFWIRDRRKLLFICAATIPFCLLMRLAGQQVLPNWMLNNGILNRATPFRLDALLFGGFLALAIRGSSREFVLRVARRAFPICAVLTLLLAIWIPKGRIWQIPYPYPEWIFTWGLSGLDILSALIILVALQPDSLVYKALSLRRLRWIGRISYGAYIFHDIPHLLYLKVATKLIQVSQVIWRTGQAVQRYEIAALGAAIALVSTLLVATLSYNLFEKPFLRLKERWTVRTER